MKICTKCKTEKPITKEYFHKNKNKKDGFMDICKTCKKEYYQNNREYFVSRTSKYRKENKEHCLEVRAEYRKENKDEIAKRLKGYYENNKEHFKQLRRIYYRENKNKVLEGVRKYNKANPHISRQYKQRRKALERKLPYTLTNEEWNNIKLYFNNSCAYCGMTEEAHLEEHNEQLHQEHFIPISQGGEYTHNNILTSCKNCNSSKYNRDFIEWYPEYEHYSKEREQLILKYLGYEKQSNTQQLALFL